MLIWSWSPSLFRVEANTFTLQLSTTDNLPLADNLSSVTEEGERRQMEGGGTDRCLRSGQRKVRGTDVQSKKQTPTEPEIHLHRHALRDFLLLLNKCI